MSKSAKSFFLSPEIHQYLLAHGTPPDAVQQELIDETRRLGDQSIMQVAPEQGALLTLLTRLLGVRNAIEVGTFTGYSALCMALGLPEDGRLLCLDLSEEWTAIGRRYWKKAGVGDRIELQIGPALDSLRALPEQETFDLAFIDADKGGYVDYFEEIVKRLRPGGLIVADNVLFFGAVIDAETTNEMVLGIRRFNDHVTADPRVECVMLPVADGITLIRKRAESERA